MKSLFLCAACFIAGCAMVLVADDPKPEAKKPPPVQVQEPVEKRELTDEEKVRLKRLLAAKSRLGSWGFIDTGHVMWAYYDLELDVYLAIMHAPSCPCLKK